MSQYYAFSLRGHRFDYHWVANPVFMGPYPVNHVFGVQVDLINFLCTHHQIEGLRSVRRYVRRLRMIDWKISGLLESLQARELAGVIPPRFVIEKSIRQIDTFLEGSIEDNPLFAHFVEGGQASKRLGRKTLARWEERVRQALSDVVFPVYRVLRDYLSVLLEKANDDDGVWKHPDGEAYYQFLLQIHTTTDLTADAIHQLGLEEVANLVNEIRSVLNLLGLSSEAPGEQMKALMEDPQYHFHGEGQRAAILEEYQHILDEVNQRLPEIFSFGSLGEITVQRLPDYKEPDSPIAYAQAPSLDGSRPGVMWINLRDPDNVYRWGMRTLAYHEGIPGHIYQMAQAQKISGLPTFRRTYFFNAYVEGWALYAERLGWELNLEDALSNLGRLQALLWRAVRLVVDTGIHVKRWTREEAIRYMVEKTGLPEQDVVAEVERYIVMPGQACAYYVGYMKMVSLRQKAEVVLGDLFDVKAFHDVVINNGSLPASLLESVVNDYIDQTAGLTNRVVES
jgi:uncharacterized protein (DUF885 family)